MSSTSSSHAPMELGPETATTGETADSDPVIFSCTADAAACQLEVSQGLAWHRARTATEGDRETVDPTAAQPMLLLMYALTCLLLVHTQDDALAQAKRNTALHGNCVATPPLSVLESNAIVT